MLKIVFILAFSKPLQNLADGFRLVDLEIKTYNNKHAKNMFEVGVASFFNNKIIHCSDQNTAGRGFLFKEAKKCGSNQSLNFTLQISYLKKSVS